MLKINSMNIYGVSRVDGRDVVYYNASLSDDSFSVTKSVVDREAYIRSRAECGADLDEFEACAIDLASGEGGIGGDAE